MNMELTHKGPYISWIIPASFPSAGFMVLFSTPERSRIKPGYQFEHISYLHFVQFLSQPSLANEANKSHSQTVIAGIMGRKAKLFCVPGLG